MAADHPVAGTRVLEAERIAPRLANEREVRIEIRRRHHDMLAAADLRIRWIPVDGVTA